MKKLKEFLFENGVVSVVVIIAAIVSFVFGFHQLSIVLLSFFFGRNWEIIKKLWKESKLKVNVDSFIDDLKK